MTLLNQRYNTSGGMELDVTLIEQRRKRGDPEAVYGRVHVTDTRGHPLEEVTGELYNIEVTPINRELQIVELHLSTGHKVKIWAKPLQAQIVISREQMERIYKKRMRSPLLDGTYKMICAWIDENWSPEEVIEEAMDNIYGKQEEE